jgi:hypothetical protein
MEVMVIPIEHIMRGGGGFSSSSSVQMTGDLSVADFGPTVVRYSIKHKLVRSFSREVS